MIRLSWQAALARAIAARNVLMVIWLLLTDPEQRYYRNFNALMAAVDAEDVTTALLKPLAVVAGKLEAGRIPDEETLWKLFYGVQRKVAANLTTRAKRRTNPLINRRRRHGSKSGPARFLFCRAEISLAERPGTTLDPREPLEQREELQAHYREVRAVPQLPLAMLQEVRRFELANDTRFGAFQAVALLAESDDEGVVIAVHAPDPERPTRRKPAPSVVRQVRTLYADALDYLG